ncbi:hypothetical protein ABTP16_18945 [Acinetobacter baumannii]
MKNSVAALFLVALVAVLVVASTTEAATCNPTALSPCAGAITSGTPPSASCCSNLKAQQSCFCSYLKNPALQPYINSPNAKKVAAACRVSIPHC